jgi:hypothetical protein
MVKLQKFGKILEKYLFSVDSTNLLIIWKFSAILLYPIFN